MDMTKATSSDGGNASVPTGDALSSMMNAGTDGAATSDGDMITPAHGAAMLGAFTILFPLGAVLLRYVSVKAHYIVQTMGLLAGIGGVGLGVYVSTMYTQVSTHIKGN